MGVTFFKGVPERTAHPLLHMWRTDLLCVYFVEQNVSGSIQEKNSQLRAISIRLPVFQNTPHFELNQKTFSFSSAAQFETTNCTIEGICWKKHLPFYLNMDNPFPGKYKVLGNHIQIFHVLICPLNSKFADEVLTSEFEF